MKKYFLRFFIAVLTFFFGLSLVEFSRAGLFSTSSEIFLDEIKEPEVQPTEAIYRELTFSDMPIFCGTDSLGNPVSFTGFKASDGTVIHSTVITGLKSERAASKRFKWEIKKADKIIEKAPYLNYWKRKIGEKAIIENDGNFPS